MNTEELLAELDAASKSILKISDALIPRDGIKNNPDYQFWQNKMEGFCNTADYLLWQIKSKAKEQKAKARKGI